MSYISLFRAFRNAVIALLGILICITFFLLIKDFFCDTSDPQISGGSITALCSSIGILFASVTYFFNRESNEKLQLEKYITYINNDINDASFMTKKGVDAYLVFSLDTKEKHVILDNLNLVLSSFESYMRLIDKNKLVTREYKDFIRTKMQLIFYSKVLWPLHDTMLKHGADFIKDKHDDSKIMIPKFSKLSIECIEFLKRKRLAIDSKNKEKIISQLRILKEQIG